MEGERVGSAQCTTYDASFIAQPHSAMSSDSVFCAVDPASTGRSAESDTENSSSRPRKWPLIQGPQHPKQTSFKSTALLGLYTSAKERYQWLVVNALQWREGSGGLLPIWVAG